MQSPSEDSAQTSWGT